MELGRPDQPPADMPSDLRRSVGDATDRIHEIIDAAERVAVQIRGDAEADARTYLAERQAEADALAKDRTEALDGLTRALADTAEQFKHQAERLLANLDRTIVDARASLYRNSAVTATGADADQPLSQPPPPPIAPEPPMAPEPYEPTPGPKLDFDLGSFDDDPSPLDPPAPHREPPAPFEPEDEPAAAAPPDGGEVPPPAEVVAYPGRTATTPGGARDPEVGGDATSEALLRATQLAVTGKRRDEIADVLRADFPGVETDALLDEILG